VKGVVLNVLAVLLLKLLVIQLVVVVWHLVKDVEPNVQVVLPQKQPEILRALAD
jgi:hypothetical protein